MAATLDRAAILAIAAPHLSRTPAWLATRGPEGAASAVQSTFVAPILRGAAWLHESGGTVRLVTVDPHDVVMQVQRTANVSLRRRGERPIAEDGAWGPETLRGARALASDAQSGAPILAATLPLAILEWALAATFHGRDGIVVIPRSVELPAFDRAQRVAREPSGHLRIEVLGENGRALPATPARAAPPVCNPQLVLSAVVPGTTPAAWATMDEAARLAAWRTYVLANPTATIPGCPPGASLDTVPLPVAPITTPPAPAAAASMPTGQLAAVAVGLAGLVYVASVVVRELRSPTPPPRAPRRFARRRLAPVRTR